MLYSHDSYGLGHLRRNLAIAGALFEAAPETSVLIVTGSPCATQFPLPPNCDIVKIPAVCKDDEGRYVPRGLDSSLQDVIEMRRNLIQATYDSFDPDVILVDHQPTGLLDELYGVLSAARKDGKFLALGVRDIVDSPERVAETWSSKQCMNAFENYYDHVFVYGDQRVFDPLIEYPLLQRIRHKVTVTGYVVEAGTRHGHRASAASGRHVLVTVGGGDDGMERIEHYLDAIRLEPAPWTTHIVTGPLMPRTEFKEYKYVIKHSDLRDRVKVTRFHGDIPGLMRHADAVVSMAGYNSCLEILLSGTPGVLLPREHMRKEQSIRAQRLAALGLAQHVPMGNISLLRRAIDRALDTKPTCETDLDFNGLDGVCDVLLRARDTRSPAAGPEARTRFGERFTPGRTGR